EKRDFFMQNLPACSLRKILLLITAVFRGDYPWPSCFFESVCFRAAGWGVWAQDGGLGSFQEPTNRMTLEPRSVVLRQQLHMLFNCPRQNEEPRSGGKFVNPVQAERV